MLFATSPKEDENDKEGFSENFFEAMNNSFTLTMELLQKLADEKGIDLTMTPEEDKKITKRLSFIRKKVDDSPLTVLANQYMHGCHDWLNSSREILKAKEDDLNSALRMQLPDRHPAEEASHLSDAIEVIGWYHFQIATKIMRAQSSAFDDKMEKWKDEDGYPKDSDGSAKVALIGIDRSIGAWGILLQALPDQEDIILDLLTKLERLRRMVEEKFPDARGFKRAGFDD